MSQEASSTRRAASAEPIARPVELHSDLYREIFAHSKEAIAIIDPEGFYLQQNGAHFTLLGYADDDLDGKTPAVCLGEANVSENFQRACAIGRLFGRDMFAAPKTAKKEISNSLCSPCATVSANRSVTSASIATSPRARRREEKLAQLLVRERTARSGCGKSKSLEG